MYKLNKVFFFSQEQKIFPVEDKLLPDHYMASSGLRKMLTLINVNTLGIWVLVCPAIFIDTVVNSNNIVIAVLLLTLIYSYRELLYSHVFFFQV